MEKSHESAPQVKLHRSINQLFSVSSAYLWRTWKNILVTVSKRLENPELRPKQREAVYTFGEAVFVSIPTDSSKSLCVCVQPEVLDKSWYVESMSIVIVTSPVVALIHTWLKQLR